MTSFDHLSMGEGQVVPGFVDAISDSASVRDCVVGSVKSPFGGHHRFAARLFADLAEAATAASHCEGLQGREERSFVVGAVLTSVAFLEAEINELYIRVDEGDAFLRTNYGANALATLKDTWRVDGRHLSLVKKYEMATNTLSSHRSASFEAALAPCSDLVTLRNALIHFKPEWDTAMDLHAALETRLRGKFAESRFANASQAYFPHRCLGAGCARWAVNVAEGCFSAFRKQIGLTLPDCGD